MINVDDIPNLIKGQVQENDFELSYLKIRDKENRVYSDQELRLLPDLPKSHSQHQEWIMRAKSLKRFIKYLQAKPNAKVLEVGCGNGWFCGKIDPFTMETIGADINLTELRQAALMFKQIKFLHHDFQIESEIDMQVDLIVFNASFQYFKFPDKLLKNLKQYLNEQGEIHIIDTPFYKKEEQLSASQQTKDYYHANNTPAMTQYYHHHTYQCLPEYDVLYQAPSRIIRKIIPDIPFPWLRIKKSALE